MFLREVDLEAMREDFLGVEADSFLVFDLDFEDCLSKTFRVDFLRAARCFSRLFLEEVCFDFDADVFLPLDSTRDEALECKLGFVYALDDFLAAGLLVDELRAFLAETEALREDDLLLGFLINSLRACFLAARSLLCLTLLWFFFTRAFAFSFSLVTRLTVLEWDLDFEVCLVDFVTDADDFLFDFCFDDERCLCSSSGLDARRFFEDLAFLLDESFAITSCFLEEDSRFLSSVDFLDLDLDEAFSLEWLF